MQWVIAMFLLFLAGPEHADPPDHSRFDQILAECVKDECVDYNLISTKYRLALFNYLASMNGVDPARLRPKDQLAYYINVYNATMLHNVVQRRDRFGDWTPADDDFAVFRQPLVHIGARQLSLNELENDIIRPTFKDARIHVALVCGARSCPPLLNRAYGGDDLDEVLDANMKRFLNDRSRNAIDDQKKELKLSRIFDWYADDFGGRDGVVGYVSKYAGKDFGGYSVSFSDYSWELNELKRRS